MKTIILLFSFLFFGLVNSLLVTSVANDNVFDIDGQVLWTGTKYYILPVVRGNGGGLKIYNQGTSQCPLGVVQEPNEVNRGTPVIFSPMNPKEQTIRVFSDLSVNFSDPTTFLCKYKNNGQPTVWRLESGASGQLYVSTGVAIEDRFRIVKLQGPNNWYKFVYCRQVCYGCGSVCADLGIVIDKNGTRRLVSNYTGNVFQVFFKKA